MSTNPSQNVTKLKLKADTDPLSIVVIHNLLDAYKKEPNRNLFLDFLVHGLMEYSATHSIPIKFLLIEKPQGIFYNKKQINLLLKVIERFNENKCPYLLGFKPLEGDACLTIYDGNPQETVDMHCVSDDDLMDLMGLEKESIHE